MRIMISALVAFMLLFPSVALAQPKIGIIDMEKVMRTSEPGQQVKAALEKMSQDVKAKLEKEKEAVKTMGDELKKQSLVLSQEAKQDKELEFKRRVRDYQDMMQNYQRKMQSENARLSKPAIKLISDVITTFGKANKFDLLMDSKNSGTVYFSEAVDVTAQVIVEINKASRAKK